jgi:hypothetical protein
MFMSKPYHTWQQRGDPISIVKDYPVEKISYIFPEQSFWLAASLSFVILCLMFGRLYNPDNVMFSNDSPHGANVAERSNPTQYFDGIWDDLNWIGTPAPDPGSSLATLLKLFCLSPISGFIFYVGIPVCFLLALRLIVCTFFYPPQKVARKESIVHGPFYYFSCWFYHLPPWKGITLFVGFYGILYLIIAITYPIFLKIIRM